MLPGFAKNKQECESQGHDNWLYNWPVTRVVQKQFDGSKRTGSSCNTEKLADVFALSCIYRYTLETGHNWLLILQQSRDSNSLQSWSCLQSAATSAIIQYSRITKLCRILRERDDASWSLHEEEPLPRVSSRYNRQDKETLTIFKMTGFLSVGSVCLPLFFLRQNKP